MNIENVENLKNIINVIEKLNTIQGINGELEIKNNKYSFSLQIVIKKHSVEKYSISIKSEKESLELIKILKSIFTDLENIYTNLQKSNKNT